MGSCKCLGLLSSPVFNKLESWGYLYILTVRGVGFTTNIFMNIALLHYGYSSLGCTGSGKEVAYLLELERYQTLKEAEQAEVECVGTVLGMKLVSAYLLLNSFSVVFSLIVTPVFGSFIDFSERRKFWTIFTVSIYVFVVSLFFFLYIGRDFTILREFYISSTSRRTTVHQPNDCSPGRCVLVLPKNDQQSTTITSNTLLPTYQPPRPSTSPRTQSKSSQMNQTGYSW